MEINANRTSASTKLDHASEERAEFGVEKNDLATVDASSLERGIGSIAALNSSRRPKLRVRMMPKFQQI